MFKKCNHLLWAITVCLLGLTANAWAAGVSGLMPESISDSVSSQKFAGLTFLPDYQDGDFGWNTDTIPRGSGTTDECAGYTLSVCPDHGNCSKCLLKPLYKLDSCNSGWSKSGNDCYAASCTAIGYKEDIPVNNICTKVSENGLTCYKDCRSISCSGYSINCDNFNVANSTGKEVCADCNNANANCSPKLCKVGSCADGFKIAENGTACIALDDNCPVDYYKECETGTEGEPQYTELGTACYKCKAKPVAGKGIGDILYSDFSTSPDVIAGKTPIGIIFNNQQKLAIALDASKQMWMNSSNYKNVGAISDINAYELALKEFNGKYNTEAAFTACTNNNVSCPAFEYSYNYQTLGTSKGNWFLASLGELKPLYYNLDKVNEGLSKVGKDTISNKQHHWTSTETNKTLAWVMYLDLDGKQGQNFILKDASRYVRPVIYYDVKPVTLPILYSDLTTSTEVIAGKTPIGIVFDESKKLAVALKDSSKLQWSTETFDVSGLTNFTTNTEAVTDWNGKTNTKTIMDYCIKNNKSCPAAEFAYNFSASGSEIGGWYLPSAGELNAVYNKKDAINTLLAKIGGTSLSTSYYWTSTEIAAAAAWHQSFNNGGVQNRYAKTSLAPSVRPIINYGDIQFSLPVLYSDLTTSTVTIAGKTPIGVVFDEEKKLAIALTDESYISWSKEEDIPDLPNIALQADAAADWNGKANTMIIRKYCKANSKSCPAAEYAYNYNTPGTDVADWYLGSVGELQLVAQKKDNLNSVLSKLNGDTIESNVCNQYWSSTEQDERSTWYVGVGGGAVPVGVAGTMWKYVSQYYCVRPIINYTNVGKGLPILYSDLTISGDVIAGKTPIGVVFDEEKKLAVALNGSSTTWSRTNFDIPDLPSYTSSTTVITDWNGKANTKTIINYCKANLKQCYAIEKVNSYTTPGTKAGDWYLPASGELKAIYTEKAAINVKMSRIGGTPLTTGYYWSSSGYNTSSAWSLLFSNGLTTTRFKTDTSSVRTVINYGDVKQSCTPLKNDNECPDWRQYPCDDGCGGRRKCCGPYYGYKFVSCTHWVVMCKQSEVKEAQEVCKMTWLDPCDMFGTSSPECSQSKYNDCLDEVEFNQCFEVVPDSSSDFIYTAPPGCMN